VIFSEVNGIDFLKKNPTVNGSPASRSQRRETLDQGREGWILCGSCRARIALEAWTLDEGSHAPLFFSNPHGHAFQLILVTKTEGMLHDGVFTADHTWFAGYEWSVGVCGTCRSHLGWQYRALRPDLGRWEFAALSREQVVFAGGKM
jgi:hypothetical protein